jgi:hypothetical protein
MSRCISLLTVACTISLFFLLTNDNIFFQGLQFGGNIFDKDRRLIEKESQVIDNEKSKHKAQNL